MSKKKKTNPFLRILEGLFIVFLVVFIASKSGYYEANIHKEVEMTEAKIKEFEELIASGEEIDLDSFLNNKRVDYSNSISHLGDKLTIGLEEFAQKSMDIMKDIVRTLF